MSVAAVVARAAGSSSDQPEVELFVNDIPVSVPPGTTVLQVRHCSVSDKPLSVLPGTTGKTLLCQGHPSVSATRYHSTTGKTLFCQ